MRSVGVAVASLVLAVLVGAAVAGPQLELDYRTQDLDRLLVRPGEGAAPLGTDHLGRDVLARLIAGARTTLGIAAGAPLLALLIAVPVGIRAAEHRGAERVVQTLTDAVLAFPAVLLVAVIAAVRSPGAGAVLIALTTLYTPVLLRVVRAETKRAMATDYVRVSRSLGTPAVVRGILHLVPAVIPAAIVSAASLASLAIGTEAALSFLGLGVQPPTPSWGGMLRDARRYIATDPWLSVAPGTAAILAAASIQYLADAASRRFTRALPRGG